MSEIAVFVGASATALLAGQVAVIVYRGLRRDLTRALTSAIGFRLRHRRIKIRDGARVRNAVTIGKKGAQLAAGPLLPIPLSPSQLALARLVTGAIPFAIALGVFIVFREDRSTAIFASCAVYGASTVAAFQWIFSALFTES